MRTNGRCIIRSTNCNPQIPLAASRQQDSPVTTWMRIRHVVLLGAALTFAGIAPPAYSTPTTKSTSGIQIVSQGTSERGGWVGFTGVGTSTSTRQLQSYGVVPAAGGTWSFGSYLNGIGQKVCYSNYYHPTARHGSSAVMNGATFRSDVGPGATSYAQVARYTFDTCYAYWR